MYRKGKIIIILVGAVVLLSASIVIAAWSFSDNWNDGCFETNDIAEDTGIQYPVTSLVSPMIITNDGDLVNGNQTDAASGNAWVLLTAYTLYPDGVDGDDVNLAYAHDIHINFPDHDTASQVGFASIEYADCNVELDGGGRKDNSWFNLSDAMWQSDFTWDTTENGHTAGQHPSEGYEWDTNDELQIAVTYACDTDAVVTGLYYALNGHPVDGICDAVSYAIYEWTSV